ncbi:NDUFAF3 domain-containing protein [Candidatus Hepatincola sp. Av]
MVFIKEYTGKKIILSNGVSLQGSFILSHDGTYYPLQIKTDVITFLNNKDNFTILKEFSNNCELALIGCGKEFIIPSLNVKQYVKSLGLNLEWAITSSSFHIFNMLVEDERPCIGLFINN